MTEVTKPPRVVGTIGASLMSINGMIGAGIFALPALLYEKTGAFAPWMFLIFGALYACGVLMAAQLATMFRASGGAQLYAQAAFGPMVGFQVGWVVLIAQAAGRAATLYVLVSYLAVFFPALSGPVARPLAMLALLAMLGGLTLSGMRRAIGGLMVGTVLKITPIVVLCVAAFAAGGVSTSFKPPSFGTFESVALLVYFAYSGTTSAAFSAGEVKNPQRTIPRSMLLSLAIIIAFYMIVQWAYIAAGAPASSDGTPLAAAAGVVMGPAGVVAAHAGGGVLDRQQCADLLRGRPPGDFRHGRARPVAGRTGACLAALPDPRPGHRIVHADRGGHFAERHIRLPRRGHLAGGAVRRTLPDRGLRPVPPARLPRSAPGPFAGLVGRGGRDHRLHPLCGVPGAAQGICTDCSADCRGQPARDGRAPRRYPGNGDQWRSIGSTHAASTYRAGAPKPRRILVSRGSCSRFTKRTIPMHSENAARPRFASLFNIRENAPHLIHRPEHQEPVVDGVRAIAVLWVVMLHMFWFQSWLFPAQVHAIFSNLATGWLSNGALGVDLFFVISGFLIGSILFGEFSKTGGIVFSRFYVRRFMRLIPVYGVVMLLGLYFLDGKNFGHAWANILYINNFLPIKEQYMGWCWSLAIEEQFYLIFPAFILLFMALRKGRLRFLVALMGLSLVIRFSVTHAVGIAPPFRITPDNPHFDTLFDVLYDKPWMRFGGLLAGATGAYLSTFHAGKIKRFFSRTRLVTGIAAVCLAVMACIAYTPSTSAMFLHMPHTARELWWAVFP